MKGLGYNVSFRFPIMIDAPECVSIGKNSVLLQNTWIHIQGMKKEEKIQIGENTSIERRCTISAASRIVIGNNVTLATNVFITDHLHAYENIDLPVKDQGITKIKAISIGDDSWLGTNVVILPGAAIGKHCVIGSNSVVNKSIPDYSVAVGIPAKVIKQYNIKKKRWLSVK